MTRLTSTRGGYFSLDFPYQSRVQVASYSKIASKAPVVSFVARMARDLNREIATPKQARQMLGLSEKPSRYD